MTHRRAIAAFATAFGLACGDGSAQRASTGAATAAPPSNDEIVVRRFGPYSFAASGVAQLPDGRILIAEDEKRHPFVLVDLFGSGAVKEFVPREIARAVRLPWLDDLEALTVDPEGHVYAATSHSLTGAGEERPEREVLVRFDLRGDAIADVAVFAGLRAALAPLHPTLAASLEKKPKHKGAGLDIEGIAWDPTRERLLLGLRSPLVAGSALILSLNNPRAVFEQHAAPVVSGPVILSLDSDGIRDLTYDPVSAQFLIVAGAARRSKHSEASLWLWDGSSPTAVRLNAPVVAGFKPEGVAVVQVHGSRALLLVCDDGRVDDEYLRGRARENRGTPSRYILIPYDTLRRWNPTL